MKKIITFEDYKKAYLGYRKYDHGHVTFANGEEKEFGFIFPSFAEIKEKTVYEYITEYIHDYFKTTQKIEKVSLNN